MPRLAANLTLLFADRPFPDRFAAASEVGFKGVEFLFPYAWKASELAIRMRALSLTPVLFDLRAGEWDAGERGIGCHPGRVGEFRESVNEALSYARTIDCRRLNALAGILPDGVDAEQARQCLVDNLRFAAGQLAESGIMLTVEPINTRDVPGYFLSRTDQALSIIREVAMPNLRLQYDVYHMQIMEGDLVRTIRSNADVLGHVQIADNPGRNQPGTGEIHFPFVLAELDRLGYDGWVGCEYHPAPGTGDGLQWAARWLGRDSTGCAGSTPT